MTSRSTEIKVGAVVVIGLALLIFFTYYVKGWNMGKTYPLYIKFDFISGLEVGAPVRLAGYKVGEVTELKLLPKEQKAMVEIEISEDYKLPKDSKARIDTSGIMGEKYIELSYGSSGETLHQGDIITGEEPFKMEDVVEKGEKIADEVEKLVSSLNNLLGKEETQSALDSLVTNMQRISENVDSIIGKEKENVSNIIMDLGEVTEKVNDALVQAETTMMAITGVVKENREDLDASLDNVRAFTERLNEDGGETFAKLGNVMEKVDKIAASLERVSLSFEGVVGDSSPELQNIVKSAKQSSDNLQKASESMRKVLQDVEEGKGTVGRLLRDEAMGIKVERSVHQVSDTIDTWHNTLDSAFLRYRFRGYQHDDGLGLDDDSSNGFRNDLTLNLKVGERNFIELGGNDIGGNNDLELMFGRRFNRLALRGGVKDSEAALAIDYALIRDKLDLSAEAIGLTDEEEKRLDLIGRYNFNDNFSVIGGVQDMGDGNNSNIGVELRY